MSAYDEEEQAHHDRVAEEAATIEDPQPTAIAVHVPPQSGAKALIAMKKTISDVITNVLQKGVHYGVIPGTRNPTLFKPGAEAIFVALDIATMLEVEEIGELDEIRYRVTATAVQRGNSMTIGQGLGECSSNEDKYMWRAALCPEEWESFPEDRRRLKYKRDGRGHKTVKQVRMQAADISNTVLKMAKKRAIVDLALTISAASDTFTQDLEDLPDGYIDPQRSSSSKAAPKVEKVADLAEGDVPDAYGEMSAAMWQVAVNKWHDRGTINEKQEGRLFAIARKEGGWSDNQVREAMKLFLKIEVSELPWGDPYNAVVEIFETTHPKE